MFLFLFWKKLKTPKKRFEITWLLVNEGLFVTRQKWQSFCLLHVAGLTVKVLLRHKKVLFKKDLVVCISFFMVEDHYGSLSPNHFPYNDPKLCTNLSCYLKIIDQEHPWWGSLTLFHAAFSATTLDAPTNPKFLVF